MEGAYLHDQLEDWLVALDLSMQDFDKAYSSNFKTAGSSFRHQIKKNDNTSPKIAERIRGLLDLGDEFYLGAPGGRWFRCDRITTSSQGIRYRFKTVSGKTFDALSDESVAVPHHFWQFLAVLSLHAKLCVSGGKGFSRNQIGIDEELIERAPPTVRVKVVAAIVSHLNISPSGLLLDRDAARTVEKLLVSIGWALPKLPSLREEICRHRAITDHFLGGCGNLERHRENAIYAFSGCSRTQLLSVASALQEQGSRIVSDVKNRRIESLTARLIAVHTEIYEISGTRDESVRAALNTVAPSIAQFCLRFPEYGNMLLDQIDDLVKILATDELFSLESWLDRQSTLFLLTRCDDLKNQLSSELETATSRKGV